MTDANRLPFFAPVVALAGMLLAWQLAVWATGVSEIIVPSPLAVGRALWTERQSLFYAMCRTSASALLGLLASVLVGLITSFFFARSKIIRTTFYPFAILLQTVPIVAVAPIVVITFGRGFLSVTLISMVISVFAIITNTTTGLLQTDVRLLELLKLHHATAWQEFWKLRLPSALPYLISGIRIAGGAAIVGAIVGEFFVGSGQPGLGALIQRKSQGIAMDELYATVIVSTLLGVTVFAVVTFVGDTILKRFFGTTLSGATTSV